MSSLNQTSDLSTKSLKPLDNSVLVKNHQRMDLKSLKIIVYTDAGLLHKQRPYVPIRIPFLIRGQIKYV